MNKNEEVTPMTVDINAKRNTPGFWRELWQQARLIYALLRDPDVPIYLKIIPFTAVAYLLFPLDFIPDIALGLGQLDDLTVILVLSKVFVELAPHQAVKRHLDFIRMQDGFDPTTDSVVIDQDVAEKIVVEKDGTAQE